MADAAGRGLGPVIGKTMHLIDLGFKTFEKLFTRAVVQIMHGSEVWGFNNFHLTEGIQNRAIRFFKVFLGLHNSIVSEICDEFMHFNDTEFFFF